MATTIEALELQITDDSSSAVSSLDKLTDSLSRLRDATSGSVGNMTKTANQITKLSQALSSLSGNQIRKLSDLANALRTLNSVSSLKLSSTISSRITELSTALNSMDSSSASKMTSLAKGLNDISTASQNTKGLSSAVKNITNLAKAADSMKSMDFSNFERLATSLSSVMSGMNGISSAAKVTTSNINTLTNATNNYSTANNRASLSTLNFWTKLRGAYAVGVRIGNVLTRLIDSVNEYQEDMNLASVSLGQYGKEAAEYAESIGDALGIDPAEFLRNQGVFDTIIKGFGVVEDKAYIMSRELTELGYDLASFYNTDVDTAMQKLTSGISGELEPLRRWGYDLSVARLKEEALALGIDKSVSSMTQAEKSMLRYEAILNQVSWTQGDMERTINNSANQIRIFQAQVTQLTRQLGSILIPILNKVLPYLTAIAKVIRNILQMLGFELPEIDWGTSTSSFASDAEDASDSLDDATKNAKKLKNALLGIDELNVISETDTSSSGSSSSGGSGGLGIDPTQYDFLSKGFESAITDMVDKIMAKIQPVIDWIKKNFDEIVATVATIGAIIAAWKIAKGLSDFINNLLKLAQSNGLSGFFDPTFLAGLGAAASSFGAFYNAIREIQEEGATFSNVLQLIGTFVSGVGGFLAMLGNTKVGGALLVIGGIAQIVAQIKEISEEGANFDNVTDLIVGIGTVMTGLLFFTGNGQWAGITVGITSAVQIIQFFHDNWEEIKNMEWGEVEWSQLILPAIGFVFGVASIFSTLKGLKKTTDTASTVTESINTATSSIGEVGDAIGGGESAGGGLTSKLTSLVKNLALGLVIIVEVAAAALIIVGAIALLGMELEQVAIAWQPVIDNASTVAIAIGVGTGLIVAVGVVTALLGTLGKTAALNIAIGTAILLEMGVATLAFVAEVWLIGKALDQVGKAWQPVIKQGSTIKTAIATSTALLIGIGVVTAALGVATVASAGLLPLAIGLGTAILVELTAAVILFIEEIGAIATEFNKLSPKLERLNEKLPTLKDNMHNFTEYMKEFAGEVVSYSKSSAIAGLATTIGNIIDFFTDDPLESLADNVEKISGQTKTLNEKLEVAVPELETAEKLLKDYKKFTESITGMDLSVSLAKPLTSNLKEVGEAIVTGFDTGITNKQGSLKTTITNWGTNVGKWFTENSFGKVNKTTWEGYAKTIVDAFNSKIQSYSSNSQSSVTTWANNVKKWFTDNSYGGVNKTTWEGYAKTIVDAFNSKIQSYSSNSQSSVTTWANNVKKWFTDNSYGGVNKTTFEGFGKDTITGFESGITTNSSTSQSSVTTWANNVKKWFTDNSYGGVNETTFEGFGKDTITGFESGITTNYSTAKSSMNTFGSSVVTWFNEPDGKTTLKSSFETIGANIIQGFIDGVNSLWDEAMERIKKFGEEVIEAGKEGTQEHSPSKAFREIGAFVIEGFNLGVIDTMSSSLALMTDWGERLQSAVPALSMGVDTSSLDSVDYSSISKDMYTEVQSSWNTNVASDGMEDALEKFYTERIESKFNQLVADTRRQADKSETVNVQVGNRTVTDAVVTQQQANGYRFVTA